jgi:hypothetical protein
MLVGRQPKIYSIDQILRGGSTRPHHTGTFDLFSELACIPWNIEGNMERTWIQTVTLS